MSRIEDLDAEKVLEKLSAEDRRWLEEQLVFYREVLEYLRDH
jgi:hypothetical protein